ncbi:MAG: DNA-3-methyladenine glycosylase [Fimbriimonadales bacterium]|jgi:DNA-3-methyladenine glycosylase|nr:DNA-3-methyladenine glycosylase [Armatimonadota bacterium]MCX7687095.1 DNA-3-methyladenine glycosylase [Fimbriimonadales bacterium]CUU06685.1 DNA-3-methyladenine glycosylase [Armatimonadetes bacterium GBS]CUU34230.1 DNA-3-methyladenine glycosylase [Armatimonadetes bacterium DC]GBC90808.1 Putative 3-methyladenine DNA glycosylase [bacterium HR14]
MEKPRPLPVEFYLQPTVEAARALLGHWLVVYHPGAGWVGGRIVEAEAYTQDDPASHSYRGRTERNAAMFGPPGTAYVYLIYGVHECFNAVCQPEGVGEAVLIRALEPTLGVEWMIRHRGHRPLTMLCRGPGNLCRALGITRAFNGESLITGRVQIWQGEPVPDSKVGVSPRIGIQKATDRLWRFYERGNPCVSGRGQ